MIRTDLKEGEVYRVVRRSSPAHHFPIGMLCSTSALDK